MRADMAVQQSAGRADPVVAQDQLMREAGSRYIDFLIPGLLGMNLMGGSIWSMGFADRRRAAAQADEAAHRHSDAA